MVWDCQFACGDGLVIGEEKKNVAPQYVPIFGSAVDANWVQFLLTVVNELGLFYFAFGCLWIVATIVVHNVSGDYKCFIALKTLALQMDDYG